MARKKKEVQKPSIQDVVSPHTAQPQDIAIAGNKIYFRKLLFIGGLLVLVTGGILLLQFFFTKPVVYVPEEVRAAVGVEVAIPVSMPSGFKLTEEPAYEEEAGLTIMRFTDKDGGFIALSQQKRPADVSLKQIDSQETYLDTIGTVYVLKGEKGRIQTIVETGDSWIYIDASESVGLSRVKKFISSLKQPS